MSPDCLDAAWWPLAELGSAVSVLAGRGADGDADTGHPPVDPDAVYEWLVWAGERAGVEVVPVESEVAGLDTFLQDGGPAIVLYQLGNAPGFLALQAGGKRSARLHGSDGSSIKVPIETLSHVLGAEHRNLVRPEAERVIAAAGVKPRRAEAVTRAMIAHRIRGEAVRGLFLLRLPATSSFARQLRQAGLGRHLAQIVVLFALLYTAEIWGWQLIGGATLAGRIDWGWLAAWLLLLVSLLPARLLAGWFEACFALDVGRLMKGRLLAGALALPLDRVKRSGVGQLIGEVMEAQALEGMALAGGFAVLVGALEMTFAAWVLARGAVPGAHLVLLALFALATIASGALLHRAMKRWTGTRLGMTNYLIEAMVGHRTRLAQERAGRRDATEDGQLSGYYASSLQMDAIAARLGSGLGSAWQICALLTLGLALAAPGVVSPARLAISLGGMMLAQRALAGIAGGISSLSRAGFAWKQIAPTFLAGSRTELGGMAPPSALGQARRDAMVIEARGLHFAHDQRSERVLDNVSLDIARGDRILIEGPSGGGKSTLASVLTGLRRVDAGLLLLGGLDRPTLGDDWHRHISAAPQFHENHILAGTLAFNLLMGRCWPPSPADLVDAEDLCEELGLGDLLRRMPGGLHQRVGETGWQLSHGERSRIFLARALLQRSTVTILDESFAALDPSTMQRCLSTALKHAETLVVIAHP